VLFNGFPYWGSRRGHNNGSDEFIKPSKFGERVLGMRDDSNKYKGSNKELGKGRLGNPQGES